MKLISILSINLLILTTVLSADDSDNQNAPPDTQDFKLEECTEMVISLLDLAHKTKVTELEYEYSIYLFNAAQTQLEMNEISEIYADDPEEFREAKREENQSLMDAANSLNKKIIGAKSLASVIEMEKERVDVLYQNSSCPSVKEALELAPEVCDKLGGLSKTCTMMENKAPSVPEL
jgi:hypothetical protein